ncbi:MAG TPA: galactose oxidase-like domain-containing protein [Mycobacteriales bacterium]|jgi:hypothetical protein|nr:galactose oxidase-like domain-containing protein [Mycobacteriales bacterium]
MATEFDAVPGWPAAANGGVGVAVADLDGDDTDVVVVLAAGGPAGQGFARYRVGRGLAGAQPPVWQDWRDVPGWPAGASADAGIAVVDVDGDDRLDLVVFTVELQDGQNAGRYRVGHELAGDGTVTRWGPWHEIPDWFSWENQGADIAVADLDGSGRPDLVVVMLDAPAGPNAAYYRVGRDLAPDGAVSGGWSPWVAVPDWQMEENQGLGVALQDLDGDGRPELLAFAVDNPAGQNAGRYTVGWGMAGTGRVADGWGPWQAVDGWPFHENQGVAVAPLGAELLVVAIDDPPVAAAGFWRTVQVRTDLDEALTLGVWRLLDMDSEINVVHAALLHTGDVLLFSGSGNDPDRVALAQRTRLWHYPRPGLDAPDTPLDLFCCGHAALPDGRLLAAGGTATYDPFHGLRDAVVFDPVAGTWSRLPDMAGGRWYPSLLTLPDGRVLAVSGLGEDGPLNLEPEVFDRATSGWSTVASPGPWPLYAHLVLLADGRVFYTGGQYGSNNGVRPSLWDMTTGTVQEVPGLTAPDLRNQSASVLLPPAQAQRVMVVGGGGWDMHNMAPAVADTALVDLSGPAPAFVQGPALHHARMHLSAVLLPDRTVLVTGGADMEEMADHASPHAEVFDAATQTWSPAAASRVPRLYHSVALLVPDGRVITAGSNPARKNEELRIEVFSPAYLFRGDRPTVTLAAAQGGYGQSVQAVVTTAAATAVGSVSLVRPGAATHSCDNEQRLVDLPFTAAADGSLTLQLPAGPTLAPPGWYLVFAVDDRGVPSHGSWFRLA